MVVLRFIKKNIVFCVAAAAALVTCCLVPPVGEYFGYFDWKTLACLFLTLAVVCALRNIKFFTIVARRLVLLSGNLRGLFLLLIVITITLNKVMLLGTSKTEVKIISTKADLIREAILSQVDRGVTILHGEGGYSREGTEVLLSILSNHELPKIERLARDIDPSCFMIINRVSEVWGRGFSFGRYENKT